VRTVIAVAVGVVVFLVATPLLVLAGAFTLRVGLGAVRYRDLHLPVLVITGSLAGGAGLALLSFRHVRVRD
jgi:hypothetical protein